MLHFFILLFGLFGLDVNLKPKYLSGNIVSKNGYSWKFVMYLFSFSEFVLLLTERFLCLLNGSIKYVCFAEHETASSVHLL